LAFQIFSAKIILRILRKAIEKKIKDVLGENQFGFRRGKRNRDAAGDAENDIRMNDGCR